MLRLTAAAERYPGLEVEIDPVLEAIAAGVVDGADVAVRAIHAGRTGHHGEDERALEPVDQLCQHVEGLEVLLGGRGVGLGRRGEDVEDDVAGRVQRVVPIVVREQTLLAPAVQLVGLVDDVVVVVRDDVLVACYASSPRPAPTAVIASELVARRVVATAHEQRGGQEGVVDVVLGHVENDGVLVHDLAHEHPRGGGRDHRVRGLGRLEEHEAGADLIVALRHEVEVRVALKGRQRVLEEDDVAVQVEYGVSEK